MTLRETATGRLWSASQYPHKKTSPSPPGGDWKGEETRGKAWSGVACSNEPSCVFFSPWLLHIVCQNLLCSWNTAAVRSTKTVNMRAWLSSACLLLSLGWVTAVPTYCTPDSASMRHGSWANFRESLVDLLPSWTLIFCCSLLTHPWDQVGTPSRPPAQPAVPAPAFQALLLV